jgi:hypothetical protein
VGFIVAMQLIALTIALIGWRTPTAESAQIVTAG